MKREDLFLAIGEVEELRLLRSEATIPSKHHREGKQMGNYETKRTGRRFLRNLLIAAVIVSMLAVTAYAVGAYVIFDSPEEMITAIFGDETGYDHKGVTTWTDPWKPGEVYENPAYDREPVDETVMAEDIVPHVSAVGQSISWKGNTLRIEANLYDSNTRCGVLTYMIENPEGVKNYELQPDGEIWYPGGQPVSVNQSCNEYIVQEKSSDTVLTIACYYQLYEGEDLEITFTHFAVLDGPKELMAVTEALLEEARRTVSPEDAIAAARARYGDEQYEAAIEGATQEEIETAAYYDLITEKFNELYTCPDKITIHCDEMDALECITLADGAVVVSPISIRIDISNMEFLQHGVSSVYTNNVERVVIRYADGAEYTVDSDDVMNSVFNLSKQSEEGSYNLLSYIFNRIIDVDNVTSVIINDTEFSVN